MFCENNVNGFKSDKVTRDRSRIKNRQLGPQTSSRFVSLEWRRALGFAQKPRLESVKHQPNSKEAGDV